MVYTKLLSNKVLTEKNDCFILLLGLLLGGIGGCILAHQQCTCACVSLPPLQDLQLAVSHRHILSLIAADCLFSVLLLLFGLSARKKGLFFTLFFLKGFCISYFVFLFVFHFQAHGFLFAVSVLLLHGFLLLPMQLTTACLLLTSSQKGIQGTRFMAICSSNLAAVLLCAVFEYFALPAVFSTYLL